MGTKYPTPFLDFFVLKTMREKRERRELPSASLFDPRCRSEFIEPRTKVHLYDESYALVLVTKDFIEDSSEEFEKSNVSDLGSVNETSYSFFYAQRGRNSPYFGLFFILGAVWLSFNALRGCLAIFALRGSLEN